jgi:hypothetical protein
MPKLYAPNGRPIVGTSEKLSGVAWILEVGPKDPDTGEFELEYDGETEIDWNSQATERGQFEPDGKEHRVFLDDRGCEWPENVLELR